MYQKNDKPGKYLVAPDKKNNMVLSYNSTHDESQEETRGKTSTNQSGFFLSFFLPNLQRW